MTKHKHSYCLLYATSYLSSDFTKFYCLDQIVQKHYFVYLSGFGKVLQQGKYQLIHFPLYFLKFIFGCPESSLQHICFLQLWRAGATLPLWCVKLLIIVASLVMEHGLQGLQASVVVARGLTCPSACGICPNQRQNPCPLHQQADSQPLDHQGSPTIRLSYVPYLAQCFLHGRISIYMY